MHGETQANRLAELMQQKGDLPSYELALPLVAVRSSSLKKLEEENILLLGFDTLECMLLKDKIVHGTVRLTKTQNKVAMVVSTVERTDLKLSNSKKYEVLKLSFGEIRSRTLSVGHIIDVSQVDFEKVTLLHNDEKIATGFLLNVDDEIAVQIDKVE